MRIIIFIALISISTTVSCDNDDTERGSLPNENFIFTDGFETQNGSLNELFPSNGSRWSTIQQTDPTNATNSISISDINFIEGQNALKIIARESDVELSKIDIEKNGLTIVQGDQVIISAKFYISGNTSIENLLLIDLECCSCWDPTVGSNYGSENQCPGVRLIMSGGNDFLSIERGKISQTTILQTSTPFPRNQWVTIEWKMTMSQDINGLNQLTINGTEVINETGMNMPNSNIFRTVFQNQGIDFTLQEPVIYERVQIGATANPTASDVELFVDDFSIEVQ